MRSLLAFVSLCVLAGLAQAAMPVGELTSSTPNVLRTTRSDCRCQFILREDEMIGDFEMAGSISALSLYIDSIFGASEFSLTLRLATTSEDCYDTDTFLLPNGGAWTTVINGTTYTTETLATDSWKFFYFDQSYPYYSGNLLVDLCLEISTMGNTIVVGSSSQECYSVIEVHEDLASGNLLDASTGNRSTNRPSVLLWGPADLLPEHLSVWDNPVYLRGETRVASGTITVVDPGVEFVCGPWAQLTCPGTLLAEGTASDSIVFRAADPALGWRYLFLGRTTVMSHVDVSGMTNRSSFSRDAQISQCRFHHNSGEPVFEFSDSGTLDLSQLRLDHNTGTLFNVEYYGYLPVLRMDHCLLDHNLSTIVGGSMLMTGWGGHIELENCTLADNEYDNLVELYGTEFNLQAVHCLFANPAIENPCSDNRPVFHYCASEQDIDASPANWDSGCLTVAPEFVDRESGDYRLQMSSDVIDAGHPSYHDADLTRLDPGAFFYDQRAPRMDPSQDVPDDQGHAVIVGWLANSVNRIAGPSADAFYSVWRRDAETGNRALVFADFNEATAYAVTHPDQPVCVGAERDGVWTFVSQVPTVDVDAYQLIAPTLADEVNYAFRVFYHDPQVVIGSMEMYALSVDNTPPDSPVGMRITGSHESLRLSWNAVETGTSSEGRSLPELNGVNYRVYHHATNPWFELEDGDYLGTVNGTSISLPTPTGNARGFYRVVAQDSAE